MDRPIWLAVVVLILVGQTGVVTAAVGGPQPPGERSAATVRPAVSPALEPDDGSVPDVPALTELADPGSVPPVVVPPIGYSRYNGSNPLDNDVRAAVYETIRQSPGDYVTAVAERVGEPVSTVRYHVRVLRREELVRTKTVRGRHRLYPANAENRELAAALNDGPTATVVSTVERREPVGVSDLASELDRAASTVSYHVSRLAEDGVLVRERDGESVLVSLAPTARAALGGGPADD